MSNELGSLLESVRVKKNLSLREAASLTGLGHSYIRDLELGINRKTGKKVVPSIQSLRKIANAYDLDMYELLYKAGLIDKHEWNESETDQSKTIPVFQSPSNENIIDRVFFPFPSGPQPDFAIFMQGDSMVNASIDDGDIVFFRKSQLPEFNGQIVALAHDDKDYVRRVTWTDQYPNYTLIPENSSYRTVHVPFHKATIYGVYCGHFKREKM